MLLRLAITGAMGCGKDFLADRLVAEQSCEKVSFAAPIKRIYEDLKLLTKLPARKDGARPFLQSIGESARQVSPNIWVLALLDMLKPDGRYVLSDLRHPNEADALRRADFFIVKVVCPEEERLARLTARDGGFDPSRMQHISETAIESIEPDLIVSGSTADAEKTWATIQRVIHDLTYSATTDRRTVGAVRVAA